MFRKRNNAWFVSGLLFLAMLLGIDTSNAFKSGQGVPLRRLDNPEVKAFARKVFDEFERKEIAEAQAWTDDGEKRSRLRWLLHDAFPSAVLYGDVDINDDGVRERFIEIQDPYYCGTVGCQTFVYRRTPKGFELMCETDLGDPLPKTHETGEILAATEDGYHLIDTGDGIIHWNMRNKPGNQCETISYKG